MDFGRFEDIPRKDAEAAIKSAIARMTPEDRAFVKRLPDEEQLVVLELFVRFDASFVEESR